MAFVLGPHLLFVSAKQVSVVVLGLTWRDLTA